MLLKSLLLISVVTGFIEAMDGMGIEVVLIPALTPLGTNKPAIAINIISAIAISSGSAYVRDRATNFKVGMFLVYLVLQC